MPFNAPLTGRIEPRGEPSWDSAAPADRLAFYRAAGEAAVRQLRAQLARAVGADGKRMDPRKRPRKDGASGPVLSPHDAASRTVRLMAARAWEDGVTVFWHAGVGKKQKKAWGTVLGYHAAGKVRGAPARDVRPADATVKKVAAEMRVWWRERQKADAARARRRPGAGDAAAAGPYEYPGRRAALARKAAALPGPKPPTKAGMSAPAAEPARPGFFRRAAGFVGKAFRKAKGVFGRKAPGA